MALSFENLDETTRKYMLEELDLDTRTGALYLSPRLTSQGREKYPELLRHAITFGDDQSLASALLSYNCISDSEKRAKPSGGTTIAKVPRNAHETLAEGEFNRFYIRGLSFRAIAEGSILVIYRAKTVTNPRPESEMKIGKTVDARKLLDDLRMCPGVEPALGLPAGPNSGLSVKVHRP